MSDNDIAIIGMAARLPGASTIDEFWENLRDGVESIRPLSDEELLAAGVSQKALDDPEYVKACPVLADVDQFDATFFGFSPRDASVMDPAHRLFLEVAWEAMEHAGRTALPEEGPVGVFAGSGASYYLMDNVRRNASLMRSMGEFLVRHTNNDMNFLSTRVSYEMDLRGPSINVQTACSTALVSVHFACESIRRGECTMAIAGGSTVLVPDRQGYQYHEGEILSPDGHCRPFDEKSAGTVFGSGSGCVVLKKLSAALDDGDTIHAVVKGSAVNNDGALRVGFLAPGVDGQAAVVSSALDNAGVHPDSITYIETHGTGTSVGDPIEVTALNQAFNARTDRRRYCAIGSVKSNIGHLGEAASVASLIKAVMALKHRQIPPSLGYDAPNPQIDFDDSPFFVNDSLRAWESDGPLRCGVTALGAGGTNCHVILEEAPAPIAGEGARAVQLLTLSAKSRDALERARERLADAFDQDRTLDVADAAYTLSLGRRTMPHRYAVAVRDREHAIAALREPASKHVVGQCTDDSAARVVFMFPGGGAQYARMGAELYEKEAVFRDATDACLAIVNNILGRDLGALMFADEANAAQAARELERPSLTLPALFTSEYALARLFFSWGAEPTALLGHSMGEYVAACLSGVMSLDSALQMVMLRGRLFEATARGAMLSVPMSESDLRAMMPSDLSVAAVNAPELCVASGPVASIDALARTLAEREIESTHIRIEVAAHSGMLDPVLAEFRQFCRTIAFRAPTIPFVSNVSGRWITAQEATDPEYWVRHLRSTVRFADCVETLRADGDPIMVEIGPGRTLSMLTRAQHSPPKHAFNSMRHPDEPASDLEFALTTLGRLSAAGASIDWSMFYDGQLRNRVPLPAYSWDHVRHWVDAPSFDATASAPDSSAEDGQRRASVSDWFERPTWRQIMPARPIERQSETVVFFASAGEFADAIAARLAASGRRVVRVSAGTAFKQDGNTITVRAAVLQDYEKLLKEVAVDGAFPSHVVHAWGATEGTTAAPLSDVLEHGFHSLHCFAQALANDNPEASFTLHTLTNNAQRVGGELLLEPAKALVLGISRVFPHEFSNVRARSIDVAIPSSRIQCDRVASAAVDEIASDSTSETVAIRGGDRYEQYLSHVPLEQFTSRLKNEGVYLITGGLGGLGGAVAEHLAKHYRAKLILIGRAAISTSARARAASLEAHGAQVELMQADVTNPTHMSAVVERAQSRFGGLHGVFHAAGMLNDSLMALKTRNDAERVLAPKVQGTIAIDRAVGDRKLDVFVLFSSISSIAGLPGQADYSAANAFLDAFAHERSARDGTFCVAVNWSAWRDVGMAASVASGAGGGAGVNEEVHPVLGRRIYSGGESELFASELSVASHWVVGEHRIRGGRSLMPGTGHLEVVRAAAQARPAAGVLEICDLSFMSALVMPDEGIREMRVQLTHTGADRLAIAIAGKTTTESGGTAWQEHVTATGGFINDAQPASLDIKSIASRCQVRTETFTAEQKSVNMDFGSRWKNLRSIQYGKNEALVTLELPSEFASDLEAFHLHPALMDMATGRCEALVPGFDAANDFYVPLSYTRVRVFGALTPKIFSHVRIAPSDFDPKELLVFNATITDETGRVLVDVEEFVMTRVTDKRQLQGEGTRVETRRSSTQFELPSAPAVAPPMVQHLDRAITSDEGMRALEHILAGPSLAQIFATPEPVGSLIAMLRKPVVHETKGRSDAPETVLFAMPDVVAVLATHVAVHECVVLQRRNRPGELKVVAYTVFKAGEQATVSDLRRFMKARLQENLVPSTFIDLDSLPRGVDGAVDISALPDPFGVVDDYVAPQSPTEVLIAEIWKEVLGVNRVSIYDNFFDTGGHSLLAVRVVVRIDKKIGVRLNQAIMVLQTLGQIAAECDKRIAARSGETEPAKVDAPRGLGRKWLSALRGD